MALLQRFYDPTRGRVVGRRPRHPRATESLVQAAVDHLCQNRTTFIVAHRLSIVVNADRIVVLRDGVIAEQGSHTELMRAAGYYASLVNKQVGGLIDIAEEA